MPRTVISLSHEDKAWLDLQAREERAPMTELVRRAVREYRERCDAAAEPSLEDLLERTRGGWRRGDGLHFQNAARDEWERRR